ncbi:hypothetical protein J4E90_008259 [Alternaria incomplexa]|uniref:uncharacterized protein n=1 Tax=Alternaria incomplexa TaxID=1187928 RepID=UPI00221FEF10|nr:uncharacterized protein J4E90_008259 [Alternaria incomplexa]KAI4909562.1 hypothetical protein J4E90_008259 [Alternaria incomplexa]
MAGPSTYAAAVSATSRPDVNSVSQPPVALPLTSPLPTQGRNGRVPINLAKQRLDLQIRLPTPGELQAYKNRKDIHGLCIDFHLRGHCITEDCKLLHGTSLAWEVYCVLQYRALGMPCPKGSGCRSLNCVNAHVCQKEECIQAGERANLCGLTNAMHRVDLYVAEWVVADDVVVQSSTPVKGNVVPVAEAQVNSGGAASFIEDLISL